MSPAITMERISSKATATPLTGGATPFSELLDMLAFRRPAWSRTERQFIRRFIEPLGVLQDRYGNLYKRIGTAPVLWSCHTDTVHRMGGKQDIAVSPERIISVADKQSNCLGADCTAGVWLMMQMIRAKRPGMYIFHRAEEIGGQGSGHIAKHGKALLDGIEYAIAFDRRAQHSIITHQGDRCCSDAFAQSLADALDLDHILDQGGTFTDTANYTDLVGECTNISVGYMSEHTVRETLEFDYLDALRASLLRLDVSLLTSERKPGDVDPDDWQFNWRDEHDDDQQPRATADYTTLVNLVRANPEAVADWLEEYGITAVDIEQAILERTGVIRR